MTARRWLLTAALVATALAPTLLALAVLTATPGRAAASPAAPAPVQVAAVLRNNGPGWAILNNTAHKPLHVVSVTDMGTYLKVTFDQTFLFVGAIAISPDETFAAQGYQAGASVGLGYMNVYMWDRAGNALIPATLTSSTGNWFVTGTMWN